MSDETPVIHLTIGMKVHGRGAKMRTDVPAPKLLLAKSYVARCTAERHWMGRWPQLYGDEAGECDCACTSYSLREGRPFGPKSKRWAGIEAQWNEWWPLMADDIIDYEADTVVTDPPLLSLKEAVKRDLYGEDKTQWQ